MAKYCASCGTQLEDDVAFCTGCGAPQNSEEKPADTNVSNQDSTNSGTVPQNNQTPPKSKMVAGLLGIFLGVFGAHNFYLGYTGKAIAQLLITILLCCFGPIISFVWALIEAIMILTGSISKDASGNSLID